MEATLTAEDPVRAAEVTLSNLRARTRAAAAVAGEHADSVDSASRFPAEALAAIKAQRLLSILVPPALGGEGRAIGEVSDVCYQLGRACASSGMIYAMHQIKTACLVRHRRGNAMLERLLRRLCAEQLLLASSTTEAKGGGNVRSSEAPIEYRDGHIHLLREASVISYGAHADGIVTTARRAADSPASDQVLVAFLKGDYTLTRTQSWSALGMRGTCSEGYTLEASGTADQIVPVPYEIVHTQTMVPFAHLLWGSVWAGIAASATARAQAFVRHAARQSGGRLPPGAPQLTKALVSLRTLQATLVRALRFYEQTMEDPKGLAALEFHSMIALTKVEASELAVSTVLSAMRACGLSGYRCDGEFSIARHLRDILSSPVMIHNDRILADHAQVALLTPIPESVAAG